MSNTNNEVKKFRKIPILIVAAMLVVFFGMSLAPVYKFSHQRKSVREPLSDVYRSECGVSAVRAGLIIGGEDYRRSEYPW